MSDTDKKVNQEENKIKELQRVITVTEDTIRVLRQNDGGGVYFGQDSQRRKRVGKPRADKQMFLAVCPRQVPWADK